MSYFRLIQSLYSMLKSSSGKYQDSTQATLKTSNEQSILEMASTNSSLAKETLDFAQNVLPAFSLAETSLLLTHGSKETHEQVQMEPTSAEKLALQVKLVYSKYSPMSTVMSVNCEGLDTDTFLVTILVDWGFSKTLTQIDIHSIA